MCLLPVFLVRFCGTTVLFQGLQKQGYQKFVFWYFKSQMNKKNKRNINQTIVEAERVRFIRRKQPVRSFPRKTLFSRTDGSETGNFKSPSLARNPNIY